MTGPDLTPEQRETLKTAVLLRLRSWYNNDEHHMQASDIAHGIRPVVARMVADARAEVITAVEAVLEHGAEADEIDDMWVKAHQVRAALTQAATPTDQP